jgi:hypothetical protein
VARYREPLAYRFARHILRLVEAARFGLLFSSEQAMRVALDVWNRLALHPTLRGARVPGDGRRLATATHTKARWVRLWKICPLLSLLYHLRVTAQEASRRALNDSPATIGPVAQGGRFAAPAPAEPVRNGRIFLPPESMLSRPRAQPGEEREQE